MRWVGFGGQRENSSLDSNYGLLRCTGAVALCAVAGEGITKQDGDVNVALQRICSGLHKCRRSSVRSNMYKGPLSSDVGVSAAFWRLAALGGSVPAPSRPRRGLVSPPKPALSPLKLTDSPDGASVHLISTDSVSKGGAIAWITPL